MTDADGMASGLVGKSYLDAATRYTLRGWRVFPVHSPSKGGGCSCGNDACKDNIGKHPRINGWHEKATIDDAIVEGWWHRWPSANVAVVMGAASGIVDIECDPRNGGDDSFLTLVDQLGPLPPTCSFRSGGGGVHRLFVAPEGRAIRKRKGWRKGVDVLAGDNSYAVMPPSRHRSGKAYVWVDEREPVELPEAWIIALELREDAETAPTAAKSHEALLYSAGSDKPGDRYSAEGDHRAFLEAHGWKFDHSDGPNEHWTRPGKDGGTSGTWHTERRIFYPFSSSVEGLEADKGYSLFSLRGQLEFGGDYGATSAAVKSEGYGPTDAAGETLPLEVEDKLRAEDKANRGRFAAELTNADTLDAVELIVMRIRAAELMDQTREDLAHVYQEVALTFGKKYKLSDCRAALLDPQRELERSRERAEFEGWLDGWVYTQEGSRGDWVNIETGGTMSVAVFDTTHEARLLSPMMRAEGKVVPPWTPTRWAINQNLAPVVAAARYAPGKAPTYEDPRDRRTYANTWRGFDPKAVIEPMLASAEEAEAVATWEGHFEWMLGKEAASLLVRFLAWVYQHPERRPHWCYTIIGPEGIGKSAILSLMGCVLGRANVGTVSKGDLASPQFNAWATGAQLRAIEELMIAFQKRETQASLMDAIGNDTVRIIKKGKDAYQADNVTAYLAFTNSRNPLILSRADRRYYITETLHRSEAFIDDLGGSVAAAAYFDKLFSSSADEFAPVLRGWLASVDLSGFDPMRAPMTKTKAALAEASRSELAATIDDLIASQDVDCALITPAAIHLGVLKAMLPGQTGQALARELRDMGYTITDTLRVSDRDSASRWAVDWTAMNKLGLDDRAGDTKAIRGYFERRDKAGKSGTELE